jgi:hypothetical protein
MRRPPNIRFIARSKMELQSELQLALGDYRRCNYAGRAGAIRDEIVRLREPEKHCELVGLMKSICS